MRARWMTGIGLAGILLFCTGASVEGVRQVREWQWAGDLALANGQPMEAYAFYRKIAETFPETSDGRWAGKRARALIGRISKPTRSPASEDPCVWVEELVDFFVWP